MSKDHFNLLLQDDEPLDVNKTESKSFGEHKNIFEYDDAYHCLDCDAKWGALSGKPVMPSKCEYELIKEDITITSETRDEIVGCLGDLLDRTEKHLGMLKLQSKSKDKDAWISQLTEYSDKIKSIMETLK